MKQIKNGLFAIVTLLCIQTLNAQTVDEIVNKYVTALGGKEKLESLKTVRMEGHIKLSGTEINLIITRSHLVGQRIDISVMGINVFQIYTPLKGWSYMPFSGPAMTEVMSDEQLNAGLSTYDLQGTLYNYVQKGHSIKLLANEKVNKVDCYQLKVTLKSGKIVTYYIDTITNFIVQSKSIQNINGQLKEVLNYYSNYKATSNGFILPFTGSNAQGEIIFTKIEANVFVDNKTFSPN